MTHRARAFRARGTAPRFQLSSYGVQEDVVPADCEYPEAEGLDCGAPAFLRSCDAHEAKVVALRIGITDRIGEFTAEIAGSASTG